MVELRAPVSLVSVEERLKGRAGAVCYPGPDPAPHEWLMELLNKGVNE